MKNMLSIAVILTGCAAIFTGCTSGYCDSGTGDSACKGGGGGGGRPVIQSWSVDCGSSTCTWTIRASGEIGLVELDITETGDPSYECGPAKDLSDCGVWHEYHTRFSVSDVGSNYEEKSMDLEIVGDYTQQVNNSSTLFNTQDEIDQLTVYWQISDPSGAYADCGVDGHMVSYYSAECSNRL